MEIEKDIGRKKKILFRLGIAILIVSIIVIVSILSFFFYMGGGPSPGAVMKPPQISAELLDIGNGTYSSLDVSHEITPSPSNGGGSFGALYLLGMLLLSLLVIFCFVKSNEKKAYRIIIYISLAVLLLALFLLWIMIRSPVVY